jgi:ABC-type antimicrobial peptide transport system ATPase subunit
MSEALLEVRNLVKHFPVASGFRGAKLSVKAVDGVSFTLKRGETLGLVARRLPDAACCSSSARPAAKWSSRVRS